ncbi:hypothetical protein [Kitasatospora sp. A2-31]|uniref:hypothetical protein n=1 Tax=Kitasatospora sp. A2-31 TaxID=2916414 RepID=UPI001EEDD3A2|nr:hypothetical protein [Kitasatospora sp. A2-31]MCG6499385.1 hypothetical protein [Kitasatospora sp. A2-31]
MSTRKRDAAAYRPRVGELVLDGRTGRTGIYMDTIGGEHYLRPEAGGREWTALPGQIGPVPDRAPVPGEEGRPPTRTPGIAAEPDRAPTPPAERGFRRESDQSPEKSALAAIKRKSAQEALRGILQGSWRIRNSGTT